MSGPPFSSTGASRPQASRGASPRVEPAAISFAVRRRRAESEHIAPEDCTVDVAALCAAGEYGIQLDLFLDYASV